ncbi:MAG: RND family transporter [Candidatus Poseidoniales archaeon]
MQQLDSVAEQINRNPLTVIGAIMIVTAIMFTVLATAPPAGDPSQSGFIPENEVVDAMTDIGEKFSTEYQVVTLIKSNDVISNSTFVDMLELEIAFVSDEDISDSLTDQQTKSNSIVSLPNLLASQFNVSSDNLSELKTFYEGISNQEIKSAVQSAMEDPSISASINPLLGEFEENGTTAKSTIITLILDNSNREGENSVQALERVAKVENVMGTISMEHRENKFQGTSAYSLGQGAMDAEINSQFEEDIGTRLMPFVLGFILLVLYLTFRSGIDMMLTLVSLFISIIWTFAFGVILDFEPSFFLTIIPILLIGLGVDYGIHLTMRYREGVVEDGDIDKSNQISVVSVGSALLFATITTMIGFFSNLSSEITPIKEFGIQTGLGILSAFIIFVTFLPACRIVIARYYKNKGEEVLSQINIDIIKAKKMGSESNALSDRFMSIGSILALKYPEKTLAFFIVLTLVAGYGGSQISSEFNAEDFLPQEVEVVKQFNYYQDNFGASAGEVSFIYISGENLATNAVFQAIDETQNQLLIDDTYISGDENGIFSALNGMRNLASNESGYFYNATFAELFNSKDGNSDGVPDTDADVKELLDWLFIGEGINQPSMIKNFIYYDEETNEYTVSYIMVTTKSKNVYYVEVSDELNKDMKALDDIESSSEINAVATGQPPIFMVVMDTITATMIQSIIYTIILSSIVLTAVFWFNDGQPLLGVLTIIPVLLVLTWILGTMVVIGYTLNVMTTLIGALTIGLGVTYAIHISHRFIEELEEHHSLEKAVNNTVKNTGFSLFGAAMTTVLSFGVLSQSILVPMQQFGTITALTILFSFLSSVWVLPSILVLWARQAGLTENKQEHENSIPETKETFEKEVVEPKSVMATTDDESEEE